MAKLVAAAEARNQSTSPYDSLDPQAQELFTPLYPQLTLCIEELSVFVEVCQEQAIHQRGFAQTRLS